MNLKIVDKLNDNYTFTVHFVNKVYVSHHISTSYGITIFMLHINDNVSLLINATDKILTQEEIKKSKLIMMKKFNTIEKGKNKIPFSESYSIFEF